MNKMYLMIPEQVKPEEMNFPTMPEVEDLQKLLGGYIEVVNVLYGGKTCQMIVDEEGLLKQRPLNIAATTPYQAAHLSKGGVPSHQPFICGPALLLVDCKLS
jgi:hypothetical protein